MKASFKYTLIALLLIGLCSLCLYVGSSFNKVEHTETTIKTDTIHTSDTIIIHDTIRVETPKPSYVEVVRVDTITQIDSISVTVPIERKTYNGEDYKAVIEGYKPELISLDIYKKDTTIKESTQINTETQTTRTKKPKWAATVGAGVGYTPKGIEPYIGVSIGYVFWSK